MPQDVTNAQNADVDKLLRKLAKFLLRNSSEGTFDLQDTMRQLGLPFGAKVECLVTMEGIVLIVTHADGVQTSGVVHAQPSLERLDLVSEFKVLALRIEAGEFSATEALKELEKLESQRAPFPWWARFIGVILFAAGFSPSMQANWSEIMWSVVLGGVMAVAYLGGERIQVLRTMLPLLAATLVAVVGFGVLNLQHAHGGPVLVMVPALFVMIPGDFLCAAAAEIAVGQFTVGTIRLVQSFFVLFQLAGGVIAGAFLTGVGTDELVSSSTINNIPWEITVVAWIPFTIGMAMTFCARRRDIPWLLLGVYVAFGVQMLFGWLFGATTGTFVSAAVLTLMGTVLARKPSRPPSLVIILGGVFVLTVGSMALRGITTAAGGNLVESFKDFTDFCLIAGGLSFGLIVGTTAGISLLRRSNPALVEATKLDR